MATKTKRAKETPTTTKARVAKARVDAKPKRRTPKATAAESKPAQATPIPASTPSASKMSCLDAAARVLQEAGEAMSTAQMIEAMATKGYWTSPGGKTPAATLYSAILRELKKTDGCRFRKTDKGRFALA